MLGVSISMDWPYYYSVRPSASSSSPMSDALEAMTLTNKYTVRVRTTDAHFATLSSSMMANVYLSPK
jgi:hypothetical protein